MYILETILAPLIWAMRIVLTGLYDVTGSYGLAIVGLSAVVALVTYPLAVYSINVEKRSKARHDAMAPALLEAHQKYKGEERFHATEAIYKEHNYHPIQQIGAISGFALQLPFLLASLILLINHPPLAGQSFLFVDDLAKPDQLFSVAGISVNVLPIVMSGLTVIEAVLKPELDVGARNRFFLIAIGLFALVYFLPAAVVLYWTSNNVWSLLRTMRRRAV